MRIYLPTPAEIRERCLEIQAAWSDRETWKRKGLREEPRWLPPGVRRPLRTRAVNSARLTPEG